RGGTLIAFVGSTFHTVDIGGAPNPFARDCYEEGLCIPALKIMRRGEENEDVIAFIAQNLREASETMGDLRAQFAAFEQAQKRLIRLLVDEKIDDLRKVTDQILDRSEQSMRAILLAAPDVELHNEITADGYDEPLTIHCTVRKKGS